MSAFRRAVVGIGKALRDTGQSIERMGCRAQDNWIFQEKFCRHRAVMNLFDQKPKMAPNVFVAPNASVIGNVEIKPNSSIWYGAVLRGDQSNLYVGGSTNIGDRTVVLTSSVNPTGFSARTYIGDWVNIGQGCVLRSCTVDNFATVGDGCVIQEGALVEERALLEAGSVLAAGMRVPTGEVYGGNPAVFVRKVGPDEMQDLEDKATAISSLATEHADEFIPYGTNYQLREQMEGAAAREKTKETK